MSRVASGSVVDADASAPLEAGANDVATTTRVELKFDRYILPTDVIRQAICLRSAPGTVKSANDCVNNVFLQPSYDPVRRVVTYYQDTTQGSGLVAGQLYTLTVLPGSGPAGFQAFDGVALDQRYELSFTPSAPPVGTIIEGPPTADGYCGPGHAAPAFNTHCKGCHVQPADPTRDPDAPMGLYLSSKEELVATAIDRTAHGTEEGGAAQHATEHPRRFGVSMAVIASSDAGQSYLLYKILAASKFPLDPADPNDAIASGEGDRLRASVVTGVPMPAKSIYSESNEANPALWFADVESISQWISAGANVSNCL